MAFNFNIDTFTEKLTKGGAMNSLFRCAVTSSKGSGMDATKFEYLCNTANLPGSTVDAATINYMGRAINLPGNRAAAQLTTSVYNDEDMAIRNHIENWMEMLNSHRSNKRDSGSVEINSYTGSLTVEQLRKAGTGVSKGYEFIQAWPSACGEIAVAWDTNDIQTFDITWEYAYWKSTQSEAGTD